MVAFAGAEKRADPGAAPRSGIGSGTGSDAVLGLGGADFAVAAPAASELVGAPDLEPADFAFGFGADFGVGAVLAPRDAYHNALP